MERANLEEEISLRDTKEFDINNLFNKAVKSQLPVALWRKPQSDKILLAISLTRDTVIDKYDLENMRSGFLFCPFEATPLHANHFIKDDILISFDANGTGKAELKPGLNSEYIKDFISESYTETPKEKLHHKSSAAFGSCNNKEAFLEYVRKAVDEIASGKFAKVVPARCKEVDLELDFRVLSLFEELEKEYPNAFVYVTAIPDTGIWIGATPENLISVDENNIFKTTALAGTQKYEDGKSLADAAWRQKEIEEQALVSRYIVSCLKRIRLREFDEIGPKTVKAGNLIHLKTDFVVDLNEVHYPFLPSVMLNLLHPTSAVCGMPKEPALDFIHRHENFSRAYFSGFLGPVNIEMQTNIFVNLRCMQLIPENKALIYAGAGVTIDSVPEKEWEETELKMETLLKKIKSK